MIAVMARMSEKPVSGADVAQNEPASLRDSNASLLHGCVRRLRTVAGAANAAARCGKVEHSITSTSVSVSKFSKSLILRALWTS